MKTNLLLPFLGALMFFFACRQEPLLIPNVTEATPVNERCGCLPPVTFEVQNITDVSAEISWNAMPEATGYQVEVLEISDENAENGPFNSKFIETTSENRLNLSGLAPNTAYQFTVTTVCRFIKSDPSAATQFETESVATRKQLPGQKRSVQSATL